MYDLLSNYRSYLLPNFYFDNRNRDVEEHHSSFDNCGN